MTNRLNPGISRLAVLLAAVLGAGLAPPSLRAQSSIPTVLVPGGAFVMGNPKGEPDERATRRVTLGSFLMGTSEITQAQFQAVMAYNPSFFRDGAEAPQRPAERVSWIEAVLFCNELSIREGLAPAYCWDTALCMVLNDYVDGRNWHAGEKVEGWIDPPAYNTALYYDLEVGPFLDAKANGYRLPSEAQWEYAASGGSATKGYLFCGGNRAEDVAWSRENASGTTHPVGRKAPNELGLYDMGGNVWEWCWDGYAAYDTRSGVEPLGPTAATRRVQRGGSWVFPGSTARPGFRFANGPATSMVDLGFRVVRLPPAPNQPAATAVFAAARSGTVAQIRDLLGRGGRLDIRDAELRTPLILAAAANPSPEVVRVLVDAGSRLHARDRYGATALLAAAGSNPDPAVVTALLGAGANRLDRLNSEPDGGGPTALMVAASSNPEPEVLKALVAAGARIDESDGGGRTPLSYAAASNPSARVLEYLIANGADPLKRGINDISLLMIAAQSNTSPDVLRVLLRAGLQVGYRDKSGRSALDLAAMSNPSAQIIGLLVSSGGDVNGAVKSGWVPLLAAASFNPSVDVLKALLAAGARRDVRDGSGKTVLMQAARSNPNPAVIEALIASGAKVTDRDNAGATALVVAAAENPVPEVTGSLLRAGAAVNDRNKDGETPLLAAVESNPSIDVVKLLLGAGAKVNEKDTEGRTALLRALDTVRYEAIWEILVASGADTAVKDASGRTAKQRLDEMRAEQRSPAR